MKIAVCSDLHINHGAHPNHLLDRYYIPRMEDSDNTILLIAGDIGDSSHSILNIRNDADLCWLDVVCDIYHQVIIVPGNHDVLDSSIAGYYQKLRAHIKFNYIENCHILYNESVTLLNGKLKIVGSTMWSDIGNNYAFNCKIARTMIEYCYGLGADGKQKLTPTETMNEFRITRAYLKEYGIRAGFDEEQILIYLTHHAPHPLSAEVRHRGDSFNSCYVSDLTDIIEQNKPTFWVHGHCHNDSDYTVDSTRVICHPRGYPHEVGLITKYEPKVIYTFPEFNKN